MTTSEAIDVRGVAEQQWSSATIISLAESAVRDAHRSGVPSIILAIPFELGPDEARLLLQSSSVSGLVLPYTSAAVRNADPEGAVGSFGKDGLWRLPGGANVGYFLRPYRPFTSPAVQEAFTPGSRGPPPEASPRRDRISPPPPAAG